MSTADTYEDFAEWYAPRPAATVGDAAREFTATPLETLTFWFTEYLDEAGVRVYALGVCSASACAPARLSAAGVAHAVNAMEPTGIDTPWEVAGEPFATGEPNPCPCDTDPGARRHWLLHC